MSPQAFNQQLSQMDRDIDQAIASIAALPSLKEKIDAKRVIKAMKADRQHFALSFYEVTD